MSVYSTPLVSLSVNDSVSSEESAYFTPEVSFFPTTTQRSLRSNYAGSRRTKSVSDIRDSTLGDFPLFRNHVPILLNNTASFREKEWDQTLDKENHYCSTPVKKQIEFTPKICRTTPLKCISNIVTPLRVNSNPLKFDKKMIKYEKESNFVPNINNNSPESTSFVYKNNLLSTKLKYRAKNGNKNKSTFLQRLGIRRKSKAEYKLLSGADLNSLVSNVSPKQNDDVNLIVKDPRVPDILKLTNNECDGNIQRGISFKYPENNLKVVDESYSSLLSQQGLTKNKTKMIWPNFHHYPKIVAMKNIRLSPLKRLFTNCRKKLSIYALKNFFVRKPLDDKSVNTVALTGVNKNPCLCSSTSLTNQELLSKILLKLNSLEEQISDIKSSIKNHGCEKSMSGNCLPPPPPPPLPPPPAPPLPNLLFSSTEAMKRKLMTPDHGQLVKRQPPAKTQFAITVEDIKSVKLRKTPSTIKRSSAGTPLTPSIKDGVVHSVKFKPVKRTVVQKKELSNLVSEILSPSKKIDQNERSCVLSAKLFEDKENQAISSNFEITPVKCKSKSMKFRSTKRRDLSLDSPSKKRLSNAHKTLVFCDNGVASHD